MTRQNNKQIFSKFCKFVWVNDNFMSSSSQLGGHGGSIGRASASRANRFHDQMFESRPEHKKNLWEFFRV